LLHSVITFNILMCLDANMLLEVRDSQQLPLERSNETILYSSILHSLSRQELMSAKYKGACNCGPFKLHVLVQGVVHHHVPPNKGGPSAVQLTTPLYPLS